MTGQMGWECPKCGRVYAPHVDQCAHCLPVSAYQTTTGTTTAVCPSCKQSIYFSPGTGCNTPWAHNISYTTCCGSHPPGTK